MHLIDLFDRASRNAPNRLAFSGAGGDLTYREAWSQTNRIARAVLASGAEVGCRFGGLSPNCTEIEVATLGAMRAGGGFCNINLRAGLEANVDILRRGACELLFFHSSVAEMVPAFTDAIPELRSVVCVDSDDTPYPSLAGWSAGESDAWLDHRVPPGSLGLQGSTGGTTGAPKLTQCSNDFILMSCLAWATTWSFDGPPVNLAVAPVTHAAGMLVWGHFAFEGTTVFMDAPTVDGILDAIETRGVTTLFLPPTLIYMLLAHPRLAETDTSSLRYLISAAAPIAPEKLIEGVAKLGPVMCQAYGQTEAGFPLTWISPAEIAAAVADETLRGRLLSCGRPTVICSIETMADDGTLLAPGETGEIVVRGPTTMDGYLNDPAATADVQAHGWHHTGDIGFRDDDGYVYITDRKRDMIVSGGFNISRSRSRASCSPIPPCRTVR